MHDRGREPGPTVTTAEEAGGIALADGDGHLDGRYPGGKGLAGLWQWIIGRMPPHAVYAEPFAGRVAVARRKTPSLQSWFVEDDPVTVKWLRSIRYPGGIVIEGDGIHWLRHAADTGILDEDSLAYIDPPYMLRTRTKKRLYRNELSDRDHADLLNVAVGLPCRVMISGYWTDLYAEVLGGWHADSRSVITRGSVMRDEWLWCNFAPLQEPSSGLAVQYSELGTDYRERERVARKVRRWQARLQAMPARERQAVLRGLLDVFPGSTIAAGDVPRASSQLASGDGEDLTAICDGSGRAQRPRPSSPAMTAAASTATNGVAVRTVRVGEGRRRW